MSSAEAETCQQHSDQLIVDMGRKKKWYLLLSNPSKTTHLGTLLRCAAAFQVHQVLLVGYDKFNCQGSFGSHLFLDIVVFPTWDSVHDYLRRGGDDNEMNDNETKCDTTDGEHISQNEQQHSKTNKIPSNAESKTNDHRNNMTPSSSTKDPITIIGITGAYGGGEEIFSTNGVPVYEDSDKKYVSLVPPSDTANPGNAPTCLPHRSFPISSRPFSSNVCFLLSKDKQGVLASQARMCDGFVHVPHLALDVDVAPASTSSQPSILPSTLIDTATTLSTVLHHYTAWARYTERTFEENQKFVKDIKPNARRRLCRVYGQNNESRDNQRENSEKAESNMEQEAMGVMLFGDSTQGTDY
eukprot:CAMPEP_0183758988 /NCGR_PEP_ID=MMETSP0739-20130205/6792_1 /TAXON_ID=385413 /ORGANISM="Thalassiosira miniscula, Strain CCMP1093" /LENGTH=354 /DNA_ID=CAMNT_0025996687 /DNA_START=21 /DNA_END=1085 /DNA_ORIENTATION=-